MLIIAGSITTEDGGRDAFLAAVKPMVAATHTEPGCREYAFSPDPDDANRILLFELWDDQDALNAHFASDHMAEFQRASAALQVTGRDIKKYTISDVGPVR
jgi:quinol monooxygenase YgiN